MPADPSTPPTHDGAPPVKDEDLDRVLKTVPQGAFALAGATVALLVLAYLAVYFLIFLPRGPIE